jgi:hypothetical protein
VKHILQGLVPLVLLLAGCGDERVVKISTEAADRQAKQNEQMAHIVNEETAFRQQAAKLQNDLRADQAAIAQQRDALEIERKQLASQREWAAFYTPLLETIGVVAVVVAGFVYCSFVVVYGLRGGGGQDEVAGEEKVAATVAATFSTPPFPPLPRSGHATGIATLRARHGLVPAR